MTDAIGPIPNRMALAGGWIDQPFVSRLDPAPPGSMVVVSLEPELRFMERSGMATSTRKVASALWREGLPERDRDALVRELYAEENRGRAHPSGSQDMIGLIYPGISRLDYDFRHEGGVFPVRVESCLDREVAQWLEARIRVIPVSTRPERYDPLGERRLEPGWIRRLGESGRRCYEAILRADLAALGESMNECMRCWEALLPFTVAGPDLSPDLKKVLAHYQERFPGAMYSGCGGGYLFVASREPVPGSFAVRVRLGAPG